MSRQSKIIMRPESKEIAYDRPAAAQIVNFIRDAIVSMELLPGQMISETALAQQFGVSRTPVREALIQLSAIGFVEVLPQRGTYVTKFSMDKILQARFIREALEVAVVSHLASGLSDDLRAEVAEVSEQIIGEQQQAAEADDPIAFQHLDDDFHRTLAHYTQYPRLVTLIESEKAHMDRVRCLALHVGGQYNRIINQHGAIVKAIRNGTADKAAAAMSAHMKDVYKILEVIPQEHPEYFV